jgi:hypothetical protein
VFDQRGSRMPWRVRWASCRQSGCAWVCRNTLPRPDRQRLAGLRLEPAQPVRRFAVAGRMGGFFP